jgi:outer membrane protein
MNKLILILVPLLSASLAGALEIQSKDLRQLVEDKNLRVSSSLMQVSAAQERQGLLSRSFVPSIKMSAASETFKTGLYGKKTQPSYGIEGNLNLFNGGRDYLESKVRDVHAQREGVYTKQVLASELREARAQYWEILFLINKLEILKSALEINKTNSQAAERRIRSGVATQTDRVEFEMESINLERELVGTQTILTNATNLLKVLLNLSAEEKIEFTEKLFHDHEFDSVMKFTKTDYEFTYKDLELTAQANTMASDKEKQAILPKVDAFAAYELYNQRERDFYNQRDRDDYVVGIRVTIDLPAGLESNREAASLRYQAQSAKALAELQERQMATHIQNEINELNFLHDQVHNAEENIKKSQRYYELTQSEYTRGVKNSPDVLNASQRLLEMKHKHLEIVRDFQMSKGHILSQLGK